MLFPFVEIFCISELYDFVYKSYSLTTVPTAVEDLKFSYTLSFNHLIIAYGFRDVLNIKSIEIN